MNKKLDVVGMDDGHDTINVCSGFDSRTQEYSYLAIKSLAVSGLDQMVALGNSDSAYETEGELLTVAQENALANHLETRFMDYPKSNLNRVLVHHALYLAGYSGKDVNLITGLPVDRYYVGGEVNDKLVQEKSESLKKGIKNLNPAISQTNVAISKVASEGIAAVYDALFDGEGNMNVEFATIVENKPVSVIDLGGGTLDIATVAERAKSIYANKSGTFPIGVISLKENIAALIKAEFGLSNEPPATYIDQAIRTKTYDVFGKLVNIESILQKAARPYVEQVKNAIIKKIGDGSDLGLIIFVGGGAAIIETIFGKEIFSEIVRQKVFIPEQPEYANARGFWKAGMYIFPQISNDPGSVE